MAISYALLSYNDQLCEVLTSVSYVGLSMSECRMNLTQTLNNLYNAWLYLIAWVIKLPKVGFPRRVRGRYKGWFEVEGQGSRSMYNIWSRMIASSQVTKLSSLGAKPSLQRWLPYSQVESIKEHAIIWELLSLTGRRLMMGGPTGWTTANGGLL